VISILPATDPQRQKECDELLGDLTDERFAELVAIGKLIGDYVGEGEAVAAGDTLDQEIGVAVEVLKGGGRKGYHAWPSKGRGKGYSAWTRNWGRGRGRDTLHGY
jgi:hypothetical protein